MSLSRTNVLSANLVPPRILSGPDLEKWILTVAQALRFNTSGRANTSGAQSAVVLDIQAEDETVYGIKGYVVGRRTSGSGSLNDGYGAVIRATYRVQGGTLTNIGQDTEFETTDIVGADSAFAINGAKIELQVTGASGYDMVWFGFAKTLLGTH